MELMMFIGADCIDTITIERSSLTRPGYLGNLVRKMKQKHQQLLDENVCEPDFLVRSLTKNKRKLGSLDNLLRLSIS